MLTAENLSGKLLEAFPCLEAAYKDRFDAIEKTLPHIVFGQLFKPYIISVFQNPFSTEGEKQHIADFLEDMAVSSDACVTAVLTDTIIEELLDDMGTYEKIEAYFGPVTRAKAELIKRFFMGDYSS